METTIKTLTTFINSKIKYSVEDYKEKFEFDFSEFGSIKIETVIEYADCFYILKARNKYILEVCRDEYYSTSLIELEEILFDSFVKWELSFSNEDMFKDLEIRVKTLLNRLELTCSIDHIDLKSLSNENAKKVKYLKEQYCEVIKEMERTVYIKFLNKAKNFREDTVEFKGVNADNEAIEWGRKNLENFHIDMLTTNVYKQ